MGSLWGVDKTIVDRPCLQVRCRSTSLNAAAGFQEITNYRRKTNEEVFALCCCPHRVCRSGYACSCSSPPSPSSPSPAVDGCFVVRGAAFGLRLFRRFGYGLQVGSAGDKRKKGGQETLWIVRHSYGVPGEGDLNPRPAKEKLFMKRTLLSLFAALVLVGVIATPAEAQHRHRHCWYSHHHRHCAWR